MKLFHISDLHLGKKVYEFPMLELQADILEQIIDAVDREKPDCLIIAGDVYDKNAPPVQAVTLFDDFLYKLTQRKLHIFIISGNHDSPERLSFGGRMLEASQIHISPVYRGEVSPVTLTDSYGEVDFYLLPYLRPSAVGKFFPEREIKNHNDAVTAAIDAMEVDYSRRCVMVSHQFVTGAVVSDSEELTVGGLENVDAAAYDGFDYVALGHIHGPQKVGSPTVRYCGTPLKYSFSEARQQKSITVATLGEKGEVEVQTVPLRPKLELREIKGSFEEVYRSLGSEDLVHITLTDEQDVHDGMGKLRGVYPHILRLDYDNRRTRENRALPTMEPREDKSPVQLFRAFYLQRNNDTMTEKQTEYIEKLIEEIWEGDA